MLLLFECLRDQECKENGQTVQEVVEGFQMDGSGERPSVFTQGFWTNSDPPDQNAPVGQTPALGKINQSLC